MLARCRGAFFLFLMPFLCLSTGCRNKTDLIEMELRAKETLYRESLQEQQNSESRILALQLEIDALRKGAKITPEQAASTFGIKRIVLGRTTGGYDNDGLPGDEQLQVVVEPRDCDEHSIKAPGALQIFVLEITPQGLKAPLCTWDISAEQLRATWTQGLLSTGYYLKLPWKQFPAYEQIRVTVRFVTPDQRVYEADRDVKVRLVPGAAQRRDPIPEAMPMPWSAPVPRADEGPLLLPTGQMAPAPHTTQWRGLEIDRPVTIGRPRPVE
jgi:hypothetical protein